MLYLRRLFRAASRNYGLALFTFSLGIAFCTVIASIVDSLLISPLPYKKAGDIVVITQRMLSEGTGADLAPAEFVDIRDARDGSAAFESVAAYIGLSRTLTGTQEAESLTGMAVSASLFRILGVNAIAGRPFSPEEDRVDAKPTVVLSHSLWKRQFAGSTTIMGQAVRLNDKLFTVVGVMPKRFSFPRESEFWIPLTPVAQRMFRLRGLRFFGVLARLKNGTTIQKAQSQLDLLSNQLAESYPKTNLGWKFKVTTLRDFTVGDLRPYLLVLIGAVVLLLLISWADVASLILAHSIDRQPEVALRMALGAGPGRLLRSFFLEGLGFALLGGLLAWGISHWLLSGVLDGSMRLLTDDPVFQKASMDLRTFVIALAISSTSGIMFGLLPAWQAFRGNLGNFFKSSGNRSTGNSRQFLARKTLVVVQLALSVALCVSAALLMSSFLHLISLDRGFDASTVLTAELRLTQPSYRQPHRAVAFCEELVSRLLRARGVEKVGLVNFLPLGGKRLVYTVNWINRSSPERQDRSIEARTTLVGREYFQVLGVPLRKGRHFTSGDDEQAPRVVLLNEKAARRFWPGQDPLGKRVTIGNDTAYEVVGVVGNIRGKALGQEPEPELFLHYLQSPWTQFHIVAKTNKETPHQALVRDLRSIIKSVDPNIPVAKIVTLNSLLRDSLQDQRLRAMIFSIFAVLSLFLTATGIYGLLSYSVRQRTTEIGVRIALGATRSDVTRMVLKQGGALTAIGLGLGLLVATLATRFLRELIYGISPSDPLIMVAVAGSLALTSLVACYIPVHRVGRIDPATALRGE